MKRNCILISVGGNAYQILQFDNSVTWINTRPTKGVKMTLTLIFNLELTL